MKDTVMRLEEYDTEARFPATVISSERITSEGADAEVREIILEIDRPEFDYELGQSIGVIVPGDPDFGTHDHFRLYSVADLPEKTASGRPRITICVRRCDYVDEYSGERYDGIASNYLCDMKAGASFPVAGPYGLAFEIPEEKDANLLLIGTGTGIAPFRAFIKQLYREHSDWKGKVWLFYGARSGLEALYMNREKDDFTQYYDEETFQAFKAFSPRPGWQDPVDWESALGDKGEELWNLLREPDTYVYVAGLEKLRGQLDKAFGKVAGSEKKWARRKAELVAGGRWVELLY
ncbi:MAG: ferredoxin-NADP reductase [Gemmatimonadetes bacterium]|nr:ferredoxin-NADP reductase [Gemmatimonadota bacterium]